MKLLWVFILFLCSSAVAAATVDSSELYISRFFDKRPGVIGVSIHEVKNGHEISTTSYRVYYRYSKLIIKHITIYKRTANEKVNKDENGNVVVSNNDISWKLYTSKEFQKEVFKLDKRGKCLQCGFYNMLHPDFLKMTNKEKKQLLDSLSKEYPYEKE